MGIHVRRFTSKKVEKTMLDLLRERGVSTACPSVIARRLNADAWRDLMDDVRQVAARLQKQGALKNKTYIHLYHSRERELPARTPES